MKQNLQERQQLTPDGQELPGWLSYQAITTTIDGIPIATGTILRLPLTYYGPSIPLGPDWTYGGESSPAATLTSETAGPIVSTISGATTSSTTDTQATSVASISQINSDSTTSSSVSTSSTSPSIIPSTPSPASSALSSFLTVSDSSTGPSIPPASTSTTAAIPSTSPETPGIFDTSSDLRTTLTVLLPSILLPLLVALSVLLLCFWLFSRRSNEYTRTAEEDPSEPIVPTATQRQTSSRYKLPLTPPRESKTAATGIVAETAPLLATSRPAQARIPSEKAQPPRFEPGEEDITDLVNPQTSSILSRLSLGLGLAPTMRRISNGTAEKAYRTPSWAIAGLAALPRRISSGFRSGPPSTIAEPVTVADKDPTPPKTSRATSHMQSSGNGNDSSAEPPSAGYARTMGDDELFYQQPQAGTVSSRTGEVDRGTRSSRDSSSHSGSSRSRSTRGTGPSNWQRHFPALEEDGPPLYTHANDALDTGTVGLAHARGETVSVGIPETPKTGADSVRSSLLLAGERRSRWVEEGDRMEFPVPPGGMPREGGQRDSMLSVASGDSEYYSANSRASGPDTPPPYSNPPHAPTVRLVQTPSNSEDNAGDTLRPIRRAFARALSNEPGSSEENRRSYAGEPLLAPGTGLAEFGELRSVSGGRADTLVSGPNNSHARSSHYASVHISDSSPSIYSRSGTDHSGSTMSTRPGGDGEENLADSGMTFGAVRDQALRGRRSQATLVSATSIRRDSGRNRTRSGPAIPPRSAPRPPPLPRLASEPERPLPHIPDQRDKRKKSWFPFGK